MSTSRTSAASSIAGTIRASWRLFAGSVTGFARRYRRDIFYRTGWNVVLLQLGFAALILALVLGALSVLYQDVLSSLIDSVIDTLAKGGVPTASDSMNAAQILEYAKQKNMVLAASGVLMIAAVFGYLITRLALTPTRDALQTQKQFVGNIAHELRTPLSIIKTNTEVSLFNERLDRETREILTSNVEELNRISDIINNLLSMNTLLRPDKIAFGNVDMGSVIDRAKSALSDFALQKRIEVDTRMSEWRTVWGNASGVEQILTNIVKNALNYTQGGGRVSISVEPFEGRQIAVVVEDNGPGIDEKDLARIFEPFYRGDSSRNRRSGGGSGLGLAIVSELVKLHKGRIAIRSAIGKGTAVSVYLPEGRIRRGTPAKEPAPGEIVMDFSRPTKGKW